MRSFQTWLKKISVVAGAVAVSAALAPAQTAKTSANTSPPRQAQGPVKPAASRTTTVAQRRPAARRTRGNWRTRQQVIDAQRAREIQEALIREGYLEGPADGVWGEKSMAAMEQYQADNGWQTRIVPDSRALIKLGLGPDYTKALNSESLTATAAAAGGGSLGGGAESTDEEQ